MTFPAILSKFLTVFFFLKGSKEIPESMETASMAKYSDAHVEITPT
jgi:hypothetical protein